MLTMDEIKNISFRKATLSAGYRTEDVDEFIDEVIATLEQQKKEKTNLVHKIDVLATRVEQYRADEETVRNALLASQKVSDACIKEAKEKAAKIVREAEAKAQALLVDANRMTAAEKEHYLQLQSDAAQLREELIGIYSKHIKSIDDLPSATDIAAAKEELDAKYPSEEINTEPEQVEETVIEEDDVKIVQSRENTELQTAQQAAKKQSKFSHLKFGDNYDVSAD